MSSHAQKVKTALNNLESAITVGDEHAAGVALAAALSEAMAHDKGKASHKGAVSASATATNEGVVEAIDSCLAAAAAPPAAAADGTPPTVGAGTWWQKLLTQIPAILDILRAIFTTP